MDESSTIMRHGIGTLRETSLHAALKDWAARPGDAVEVKVDGYFIDIQRGDTLIEIQTRNFNALKPKLARLIEKHPVKLIYPISVEKWILRQDENGQPVSRRKSPRKGRLEHVFLELIRFPHLVASPNFSFQAVLVREEEIQVDDGRGSWRRAKRSIFDRRLMDVIEAVTFNSPADFGRLLPAGLPESFSVSELALALGVSLSLARKMAYCLRRMGVIDQAGKRARAYLYRKV
jgi:hypothetical protein